MAQVIDAGSEFSVNTTSERSQAHAELTRLADGRLLAVWIDADFNTTADRFVRAQIFSEGGTPLGGELTLTASSGIRPDVTGLSGGGFALSWAGTSGLRVQTFDTQGAAAGPMQTVHFGSANQPEITALAGGGFAIVWDDADPSEADASGSGVQLTTFDATGTRLLDGVTVNTMTSGNQVDASVTGLADGGFVVTWTDNGPRGSGATWVIKAQVYDASGARVGGEILVSSPATGANALESAATTLANGNFAIGWYADGAHHVQVFTPEGVKLGAEVSVSGGMFGAPAMGPAIAALSHGGYAIAWQDNGGQPSDGSGSAIFVQAYDAWARPAGEVQRVNTQTEGNQIDPSVVGMAGGGFVVSWTDLHGEGADDDEVRAQIFDWVAGAPEVAITSNGAGDGAAIEISENGLAVTFVSALAIENEMPLRYAITGGDDATAFTIDPESGALCFVAAPDYEARADFDHDNDYDVIVTASAGEASDSQRLSISVANINEPLLNWEGATFDVGENTNLVHQFQAIDPDGETLTYAISGGADAALFTINALTGSLYFLYGRDFENPTSADGGDYRVSVTASGATTAEQRDFLVRIVDMNEALTISSNGGGANAPVQVAEGQTLVTVVHADDPERGFVGYRIVGGEDAALFTIDVLNGELRFVEAPDYEAPRDADGNGLYRVVVQASDNLHVDDQAILVEVTNVRGTVNFTSFAGAAAAVVELPENATDVAVLAASDGEGGSVQYRIAGGADAERFAVDRYTGALRFLTPPDAELPGDADGDNKYDVTVEAGDGYTFDTQNLLVAVHDVREPVAFTSFGGAASVQLTVNENVASVAMVHAETPEGAPIRYSIIGGVDASLFGIDVQTGAVWFRNAPDFENARDQNRDNRYEVVVAAKDDVTSDTQALVITVADVAEGRVVTGTLGGDTISTTAANPALRTSAGADIIYGLAGNDQIAGGGGEDRLDGGAGSDTLIGGGDADVLIGGAGSDLFMFTAVTDSRAGAVDQILDFSRAEGDKIHLASIDANSNASGDQAFIFIGTGGFTGQAGQLRYSQSGGDTYLYVDINGDRVADMQIQLEGYFPLSASDFIL